MNGIQKILVMVVGVAGVTTLILPDRKTPQVINAFTQFFRGSLATAMGTGKKI